MKSVQRLCDILSSPFTLQRSHTARIIPARILWIYWALRIDF